ncbi:ABC transporter ATP-binding protein [Tropicimonas marinistellae]|uniref:ABC transporter ATP-binding protein n=1 Tax=Tropicimonas marinistellae TaxID=1739787 RepID=UPI00082F3CB5|nr:ABC transporter ATP-binding protein [Tropicimonas marinistellae]
MTAPKLELVSLRKEYDGGQVVAVEDLDLVVEAGETLAILGPSGCGKSTTLNMIVGLETPTRGEILIDGVSATEQPAGKRNVGLVFQDYAVFTHQSVRRNLAFGLEVRGVGRVETRERVEEVAELLGLTDMLDARAASLGGSQLQRVAIGRTLVTRPALLLLDEPLSNLETEMRATMRRELRRLQAESGLTIIYVTHDQIEALSLARRIAVMSHGKLRQCDRSEVVYEKPSHTFVAGFIGEPPMNLLPGSLDVTDGRCEFVSDAFRVPAQDAEGRVASGEKLVLGIRPDAIRLAAPEVSQGTARVVGVEPRGAETILTLAIGDHFVSAMARSHGCPQDGDTVGIAFNENRLTFFDGETNRNLTEALA